MLEVLGGQLPIGLDPSCVDAPHKPAGAEEERRHWMPEPHPGVLWQGASRGRSVTGYGKALGTHLP